MKEAEKRMKFYTLDNVISKTQLFKLYNIIISTPNWTLDRTSSGLNDLEAIGFPGMIIEDEGNSHNTYLSGYFHSLLDVVKLQFEDKYKFNLPHHIHRINLGAKNDKSETQYHADKVANNSWTILGFITPVWKLEDGGEFKVEGDTIEYKPGRFIIFRSHLLHNGGFVRNNNLSYWRISVNIILSDE
jgi:hypothetical protein